MLRQLHIKHQARSSQKYPKFIPFQKQRDNLGRIIRPKTQKKTECNIMKMFENLKKSTKQYLFEKQFEKMSKKFEHVKRSLNNKEHDYQKQVENCIKIAEEMIQNRNQGNKNKENLYISLREKIDGKINGTSLGLKKLRANSPMKSQLSRPRQILRGLEPEDRCINIGLFKTLSARSEMMATFCSNGLKYEGLVEEKKFDPWKTWYKKQQFQLFPGKKVQVKCLQKSIYQ